MSYLHEMALGDATKALYMLGSSSRRKDDAGGLEGFGGAVTGAVKGMAKRQSSKLEDAKKRAIMADAIQKAKEAKAIEDDYTQFERSEARAERADIEAIKYGTDDPFKQAQARMSTNRAAEMAPIGGQYTRPGFKRMLDQAEIEAEDYNTARGIIRGMSGTGEVY